MINQRKSRKGGRRQGRPSTSFTLGGDCRIVHREYIQDLTAQASSPSLFNVAANLPVNPGQAVTFPWLSQVAKSFESYRFNRLDFVYATEAPSTLGGTQILTLDYDATDAPPTGKQQALDLRAAVRSAPWKNCVHRSAREDLHKQKSYFVRPGAQPANTDIKMYDVGNFFAINQGVTTGGAVTGELYVEYDVTLMTPTIEFEATGEGAFGVMTAAAGTVASPMLAGVPSGTIPITQALTVMSFSDLVIGQEYLVEQIWTADAVNTTFGALTGWTATTNPLLGGAANGGNGFTAVATETTASVAITISGAPGKGVLSIVPVEGIPF
jgi:hypothetical protein